MANFLTRMFSRRRESRDGTTTLSFGGGTTTVSTTQALRLSAVYSCVDIISSSIAQMPLVTYKLGTKGKKIATDHPAYNLLMREPNRFMSRYMMMDMLVKSMILSGNGYIYIRRDERGEAAELLPLHPSLVTIVNDENNHIQAYTHPQYGWIEPADMIHVPNFSTDGEHGRSTLRYAMETLGVAYDSERFAKGFFEGGANVSGIVSISHPISKAQKEAFLRSWYANFSPHTGHPNGIAILESDMDFKPITVNPVDAQLLETRKYNVVEICRFFRVSPQKVFDLEHASYSSLEATNLAFLTDTLQPNLVKIEQEFERKLFLPSRKMKYEVYFDTSSLLRTDKTALSNWYTKLYQIGAMTTNEIRKDLDLSPVDGGDTAFIQANLVPIDSPLERPQAQQQEPIDDSESNNQDQNDPSSQGGEQ